MLFRSLSESPGSCRYPHQGYNLSVHDLAADKEENMYAGDILHNTIQKFRKVKGGKE